MNVVTSIKEGSHTAFEQVYEEFHERLYFYVLGKTKSNYMAEEVVQLTFFKLWQYRKTLNEELPIAAQLFRIANTTFINLLYKESNERKALQGYRNNFENEAIDDVLQQVNKNQTEQKIKEIVQAMPLMRRRVFELSRYHGMSYSEIASKLSISIKTVEAHISKALHQLRRITTLFSFIIVVLLHR